MFMGNDTRVQVVSLGIVRLHLNAEKNISFFFFLQNVAYIPSIRINLIYVLILDRLEYSFLLELEKLIYIETLY